MEKESDRQRHGEKKKKESETDIQTEKRQRNGEGQIGRQSSLYIIFTITPRVSATTSTA